MHRRLAAPTALLALTTLIQGAPAPTRAATVPPPLPAAAREALRAARAGQTVTLPAGQWSGPLTAEVAGVTIEAEGVTLSGDRTLLTVTAPGVRVRGLRLRGAGGAAAGAPAVAVRGGGLQAEGLVAA
jgi:nitrous oxidase accessory protein NosD